jgi:uncharacterized protein
MDSEAGTRPFPVVTRDTEFFWEAARDHRLAIQHCVSCGGLRHPPMPACPTCQSLQWDTVVASGRGTLFSFTVIHRAPEPFVVPFVVGVIALEEGTRLVAELVDVAPDDVSIGMPLSLDFLDVAPGLSLPVFRAVVA